MLARQGGSRSQSEDSSALDLDEGKKAGRLVVCKEAVLALEGLTAQKRQGHVSRHLAGLRMEGYTMLEGAAPGKLYLYRR